MRTQIRIPATGEFGLTIPGLKYYSICVATLAFMLPATVFACIWDYDTLKQEQSRFPKVLELITGKFLRHSKEFYEWRIQDRLTRLKREPSNLAWHDDLAVAYEKTGQHAKAIETMLEKEKLKPGEYETYANLGTFHILAGDFELGLPLIDKALAINPNAHFGREKYQKWLVEYALSRRIGNQLNFPLRTSVKYNQLNPAKRIDFLVFLEQKQGTKPFSTNDRQAAIKAVLGMMRFANHENPLLLEALGDLLLCDTSNHKDAKRLAARCFLKASYTVKDESVREAYLEHAEEVLKGQLKNPSSKKLLTAEQIKSQTPDDIKAQFAELTIDDLRSEFAKELADADKWHAELRQKELNWIKEGKNADEEFDRLYTRESEVKVETPPKSNNAKKGTIR